MKLLAASLLTVFFGTAAWAEDAAPQSDPEKIALATRILDETHAQQNMVQAINAMVPELVGIVKQQSPGLSDSTIQMISDLVTQELTQRLPELNAINARVYAEHFSLDDLKAIDAFYQGPTGQKVIVETPKIFAEVLPVGAEWGRQAGVAALQKVIEKLRAQGVKI